MKVVETFKKRKIDFFVCEPNLDKSEEYKLINPEEAVENCDLIIFLVSHREFFNLKISGKQVLDFCGVKK